MSINIMFMAMLAKTPKLNPPHRGVIEAPQPGTLTALSSGTAVLAPIEWLLEINARGVQPGGFLFSGLVNSVSDRHQQNQTLGTDYESGGQEFESLRARQHLAGLL